MEIETLARRSLLPALGSRPEAAPRLPGMAA